MLLLSYEAITGSKHVSFFPIFLHPPVPSCPAQRKHGGYTTGQKRHGDLSRDLETNVWPLFSHTVCSEVCAPWCRLFRLFRLFRPVRFQAWRKEKQKKSAGLGSGPIIICCSSELERRLFRPDDGANAWPFMSSFSLCTYATQSHTRVTEICSLRRNNSLVGAIALYLSPPALRPWPWNGSPSVSTALYLEPTASSTLCTSEGLVCQWTLPKSLRDPIFCPRIRWHLVFKAKMGDPLFFCLPPCPSVPPFYFFRTYGRANGNDGACSVERASRFH
jgi:hypothetical protein